MEKKERAEIERDIREQVRIACDTAERGLAQIGEHFDLGIGARKVSETDREVCTALNVALEIVARELARPELADTNGIGLTEAQVILTGELLERDLPLCSPTATHGRHIDPRRDD
jgi:hypothetical protein